MVRKGNETKYKTISSSPEAGLNTYNFLTKFESFEISKGKGWEGVDRYIQSAGLGLRVPKTGVTQRYQML